MDNRKKIIIAIVIFVILSIAAIVLAVLQNTPKSSPQPTSTTYVDPGSGETVIESDNGPTAGNTQQLAIPTFLGFSKLTEKGLSSDQVEQVKSALSAYSAKQSTKFSEISLTVATINRIQSTTDPDITEFSIKVNRKDDYFVRVESPTVLTTTTKLYTADKSTLLFTQ